MILDGVYKELRLSVAVGSIVCGPVNGKEEALGTGKIPADVVAVSIGGVPVIPDEPLMIPGGVVSGVVSG